MHGSRETGIGGTIEDLFTHNWGSKDAEKQPIRSALIGQNVFVPMPASYKRPSLSGYESSIHAPAGAKEIYDWISKGTSDWMM